MVWLGGSNGGKIVLTLLIKVITFYIRSTTINMKRLGLELILGE